MARIPKHTPEQLLELARAAIASDPDTTVAAFRSSYRIGNGDARAVLEAAKWESSHRQYGHVQRDNLDVRWRNLVRPPAFVSAVTAIDYQAAPERLRQELESALERTREIATSVIAAMQLKAQQVVDECERRAQQAIEEAREHERQIISDVDFAQQTTAQIEAQLERERRELGERIAALSQELRDKERLVAEAEVHLSEINRERHTAEQRHQQAIEALEHEREASRHQIADLTSELSRSQRDTGAAEAASASMKARIEDLHALLREANVEMRAAQRESADRAAEAARADGRSRALEEMHLSEMGRLQERIAQLEKPR